MFLQIQKQAIAGILLTNLAGTTDIAGYSGLECRWLSSVAPHLYSNVRWSTHYIRQPFWQGFADGAAATRLPPSSVLRTDAPERRAELTMGESDCTMSSLAIGQQLV